MGSKLWLKAVRNPILLKIYLMKPMQNQTQTARKTLNKGKGLGYSGRGFKTNMNKNAKAIAALYDRLELEPDLELIEDEFAPSKSSGHCILAWNNPAYGKLLLAEYVKPSEISKVLDELPKWKYVAQSSAIAYEEWNKSLILPDGSVILWKLSCDFTFKTRDIKYGSFWKREEKISNDDWRYVDLIDAPDFRGATSGDRKYYLPSGEEVMRTNWNQNQEWFSAVRRWDLNNN